MAFNVANFASNINQYGTLQTNRFEVSIKRPTGLSADYNFRAPLLTFRAEQVKLPGFESALYDSRRYGVGPLFKVATGIQNTQTTITFIETDRNDILKLFYEWSNLIVDYKSFRTGGPIERSLFATGYKSDIVSEINIKIFNNTGVKSRYNELSGSSRNDTIQGPVTTVTLVDAFPSNVSETALSWSDNNSLYKVNVTFEFPTWYIETEQ
jgi:hypothetical protein